MTKTNINKRKIGAEYEEQAARYLIKNGYRILERNYHNRFGEIDIIAEDQNDMVFCEIKYRATPESGDPLEAVDYVKQKHICKTAMYYYTYHGMAEERNCRFDVIGFRGDGSMEHVRNAFEYVGEN